MARAIGVKQTVVSNWKTRGGYREWCLEQDRALETRLLQDNLAAWRAGYAPATALEAAVLMATVGTRDAVLQLERAKAAAKPAPSLRPDRGTARSKEAPFLVLRGLSVEYAGAQPVLHLELVHNRESRQVVTAFSNALSKYCPAGYQFNFRPVERANSVLIDTTWRLQ